jgi:PTS system ascorbate-specific IIA component
MELLKRENVQILEKASNWKEAINLSILPLENGGYVEACYKEAIISNMEELGPYIVISENIALPHARPEQGVKESQLAVTLFKEAVELKDSWTPIRLFISLAANDGEKHLQALATITQILQDQEKVKGILSANDADELYKYFN